MTKKWLITLLLLPAMHVGAQSIRLTRYDAPNALYLDADRLYNFNMYERSRFELGLVWVSPSETAAQQRKVFGQWTLTPYIAYGTGDRAWKYGMGTQLRLPGQHDVRLLLWGYNDVERAASRRLTDYRMLVQSLNNGIVTSRFVGVKGGGLDLMATLRRGLDVRVGILQTWENYLFDSTGCLYPARDESQRTPTKMFTEAHARIDWRKCVTLLLRGGRVEEWEQIENSPRYYLQALAQYDADLGKALRPHLLQVLYYREEYDPDFGGTRMPLLDGLHLFGQLGFASQEAPYSRMFDLSGTAYAMYFFKQSFLTVRPNRFAANVFAHVCLNYTAPMPLWELSWSSPHPFLQVNAMWGHLLGQDAEGRRLWEGLPLQAPNKGLLEPATGFDRLVHWGLLDIGFGVAYQICPMSANYIYDRIEDNIAFTIVADFILDRY